LRKGGEGKEKGQRKKGGKGGKGKEGKRTGGGEEEKGGHYPVLLGCLLFFYTHARHDSDHVPFRDGLTSDQTIRG